MEHVASNNLEYLTKELEKIRVFLDEQVATKQDLAMLYNQLTHHTDKDVVKLENKLKNNIEDVEDEVVSEMGKTIHLELEGIKKGLQALEHRPVTEEIIETDQELLGLKTRLENLEKQVKKLRNTIV